MKLKVSEATLPQIDWLVATAEGWEYDDIANAAMPDRNKKYSTSWAQGGPIIEREGIGFQPDTGINWWVAHIGGNGLEYGPTPLIAAMRCYVASKLGEEVDVPEELT